MQQIADLVGVTRGRIQQITSKFGLNRLDGVRARRAEVAKRHANRLHAIHKENRSLKWWGCTNSERLRLNGGKPWRQPGTLAFAFFTKKRNVCRKSVALWKITFPEWVSLWQGLPPPGGRHRDALCLVRTHRDKPFTIDNVEIVPFHHAVLYRNPRRKRQRKF